jgi:hypothetical protein
VVKACRWPFQVAETNQPVLGERELKPPDRWDVTTGLALALKSRHENFILSKHRYGRENLARSAKVVSTREDWVSMMTAGHLSPSPVDSQAPPCTDR